MTLKVAASHVPAFRVFLASHSSPCLCLWLLLLRTLLLWTFMGKLAIFSLVAKASVQGYIKSLWFSPTLELLELL